MSPPAVSPGQFSSFGDLLKYLRRREQLTQRELALQVGYSDTQISRIEQNRRIPDAATLNALFVPALHLEREPEWVARLLELAKGARQVDDLPGELPGKPAVSDNLPTSLTSFIGREKEQARISLLIHKHRLVTLTGPGGIGKTRLALAIGQNALGDFADGIWLIELAPVSEPDSVEQAVASALGLPINTTLTYIQLLINFLGSRQMLLILDNCEHLLDACARLADTLLKHCPGLKILATSREALGILGEAQFRVSPMQVPDANLLPGRLYDYESLRLFEARAQLVQPDFVLTAGNAAPVAQICTRLDGIPLAIELAAARVNLFSTEQIAARLEDGFSLLSGGSRTELPRRQTIRASIDWSWNLISDAERALLRRLTVFSGGWTAEAAELICSSEQLGPGQVLELMIQLAAKSLIHPGAQEGSSRRFHLHEMIRQYAHEKLLEAGEELQVRSRHLAYFLRLCEQAEPSLHGPQQGEWFHRLMMERDNLRLALDHASRADLESGLFLAARLAEFWRYFDLREGLRWTSQLIQDEESGSYPHARAWALMAKGNILWHMQQFREAHSIAQDCLVVFRACSDQRGEFAALTLIGAALQFLEGMQQKKEAQLQALDLARAMGDIWMQAVMLSNLGWDQRDPAVGRAYWEEAIALFRQTGDQRGLAQTLSILGLTILSRDEVDAAERYLDEAMEVNRQIDNQEMEFVWTGKSLIALMRGDYAQARAYLGENLNMQEAVGNRMGLLWGRLRLAYVALHEGSLPESRALLAEVIKDFHADRNPSGLASALDKMASLFILEKKHALAASLLGWSGEVRAAIGDPRPRLEQDDLDGSIAIIMDAIGARAYRAAYDSGRQMTLDEAVRCALEDSPTQ